MKPFARKLHTINTFDIVNALLMLLICIVTLYPFLYILSLSLSPGDISFATLHIIPPKITMANFHKVLTNDFVISGFVNTIIRTFLGTALSLMATIFAAYTLSKKYFPHRSFWTAFVVFTMFFSGGLIPNYLLVKSLGLMNSTWALILPGLISTFSMIIARNFFMALPESLEESAKIDGANDLHILFRIMIPISMPIIATLTLWIAVAHWNAWFDSLIYITDASKQVLQIVMRRIVLEGTQQMMDLNAFDDNSLAVNPETIKAATILVTIIPIILFYPFLQKYFVKGVLVGSLKG
ncbi:carbohydrate ABC transporter permease [Paenibacillus eucommiae]|uniref:Aldouronate transport system permease protein n=1 Tax=Paenibacillus eucommiae TaxID=1355755 RepID=A0ABS4IPG3_9BACL|nr:carbohydrate ABC transporter permease [Paenibacillus eucommiae]MBP1989405.1 putative aldouronate transport system permease protein [Paenibacillus eucommiae]